MNISRRAAGVIAAVVLATVLGTVPAEAVIHEIVAQWCSGREPLGPHGLSRGGSKNFAQPVNANGFVGDAVFNASLGGLLVTFNYDHPASKVRGTGTFIQIGSTPDGVPIFIERVEPDPDFAAFQHCPRLAGN